MLWKLTAVLAFSLAWLAAPAVRADSDTPECCDYNGPYVGIGGGYSFEDFDNGEAGDSGYVNGRVGVRFLDFLAVEGMGEYMPDFDGANGHYNNGHTEIWSVYLNGKLYPTARLTGLIQPYLLAGAGGMFGDTNKDDDNGFAARFGGGIDFFLTEHVIFTTDAAYLHPMGGAKLLDQFVVGGALQYRF